MKQTYNNRGWIEWAEVPEEDTSNVPEVSPKVFREMKQKYEEEGKQVMITGERFYGALLLVDGEYVAKRIKPEVWETCGSTEHNQSVAKNKEMEEANIAEANKPKPIYCLENKDNWQFYCPIAAILGFIFHPLVCFLLMIIGVLGGLLFACVQALFGLFLACIGIDYGDVWFPDNMSILNPIAEHRWTSAILVCIISYFVLKLFNAESLRKRKTNSPKKIQ